MSVNKILMGAGPAALLERKDPFVLVEGPAGTSKSNSVLKLFVKDAINYPNCRILLARQTRTSLTQSTLVTLEEEVFPQFGLNIPGGAGRENRSEYRLPNGSTFALVGLEDPERTYSTKWDRILVEEGIEVSEDTGMKLARGMRGTATPQPQAVFVTNPGPPGHWLNTIAEPAGDDLRRISTREEYLMLQRFNRANPPSDKWKRIITRHQDNPAYFDHAAWKFTEFGDQYVNGTLAKMSGHLRKRMLDGIWCAASGAVFPEWDRDHHVVENFEPPSDWPMAVFYDPGWGTTAVLWVAGSPDGGIFVVDEIYSGQQSIEEHCEEILRRNREHGRNVLKYFGDPNELTSNKSTGRACDVQAMKYGIRFVPWPKAKLAAFDASVEQVRHTLKNTKRADKPPMYLSVCKRCTGLISNFESWSYRRNTDGTLIEGADQYEKGNDHALDDLRGALISRFFEDAHRRSKNL